MSALLSVENLSVEFATTRGAVHAVEDLSFAIQERETVAIVGESGSGKTTAALALLRLLARGAGQIRSGQVMFEGRDLARLPESELRSIRGRRIAMIFQDPMMALNPVYTVGRQIAEAIRLHEKVSQRAARARSIELLHKVRIPAPERRVHQYPHNISGGMRQRVMIAIALACRPSLLIADEPTTALDVTVQAQVLDLINDLKAELGMAVLLITHDLGVVWEVAQRVVVMYGGRKVEEGRTDQVFGAPRHPYTRGLLRAAQWTEGDGGRLVEIPGTVPAPFERPAGCAYAPRCELAFERCRCAVPALRRYAADHEAACFAAEAAPC
jgi:oligopeptide/dipeptide ABC transporter ATP-binding protein